MPAKDSGSYFDDDRHVELAVGEDLPGGAWTLTGWFIWIEGAGPFVRDSAPADRQWQFGYEASGQIAFRVAGAEHRTSLRRADLHEGWHQLAVVKDGPTVRFFIDDLMTEVGGAPDEPLSSPLVCMQGIVGFAADFVPFAHALPDDAILAFWHANKGET